MSIKKVKNQPLYEVKFYVKSRKEAKKALVMHGGAPFITPTSTPAPANLPLPPAHLSPFAVYQYYVTNGSSHNQSAMHFMERLFQEFNAMTSVDYQGALDELNRRFRRDPLYPIMRRTLDDQFEDITSR